MAKEYSHLFYCSTMRADYTQLVSCYQNQLSPSPGRSPFLVAIAPEGRGPDRPCKGQGSLSLVLPSARHSSASRLLPQVPPRLRGSTTRPPSSCPMGGLAFGAWRRASTPACPRDSQRARTRQDSRGATRRRALLIRFSSAQPAGGATRTLTWGALVGRNPSRLVSGALTRTSRGPSRSGLKFQPGAARGRRSEINLRLLAPLR